MEDGISTLANFDSALFEHANPPLASIYLPLHGRAGAEEDRVQFKNLVEEVRSKLAQEYEHREHANLDGRLDEVAMHLEDLAGGASGGSLQRGAPTLLSRSYLEAYANGATRWNSGAVQFGGTATVVQEDANPGSEPAVNDDGSLSVYISDENSDSYFASPPVSP